MKLTETKLKKLINEVIGEVYKLTPEEESERGSMNLDPKTSTLDPDIARDKRRVRGLQDTGEIRNERDIMRTYQEKLKNHPDGPAMIQDFQSEEGRINVYHSIDYHSDAQGSKKFKSLSSKPFSTWLKRFGSNSKDSLSTVATIGSLGSVYQGSSNANYAVVNSVGFLVKGYPAFVSEHDVMSQTHGSVPDSLKKHQKNSGLAKRSGDLSLGLYGFDWKVSSETILDNWSPYAIYFSDMFFHRHKELTEETAKMLIDDAMSTGLPVYNFTDYGPVRLEDEGEIKRLMLRTHMFMRS
tara:strand:+ start:20 stop:907 length:888 start_codon:yes stop_codon:yes gene_type:complete